MKTLNQCEHTIRTWDAVKLVFFWQFINHFSSLRFKFKNIILSWIRFQKLMVVALKFGKVGKR
jgi:hypothetical protein